MRARTAPQKEGLFPCECIYGRPFLCTDIVIDPETLELTNYVTQLSAFQQALTELQEQLLNQSLCQASLYLGQEPRSSWKHWGLGAHPSSPSGKDLTRLFFLLPQLSKYQELIRGYITLELRGVTLTRTKWLHFVFTFYVMTLYFSDGPDNLCEPTYADSKNPESAIWSSRQCLPVLGSLLCSISPSV